MTNEYDLLKRFLIEGEYNDDGDYVFKSDTPESGPQAEPDTMVPALALEVAEFLRQPDHRETAARAMLAALKRAAICRTSEESAKRPPDFYESAFNILVADARAAIAAAESAGITER